MRDVNLRKALDAWAMLGNELMLSRFMAGERIVEAVIKTPLTFDDVGRIADLGGAIKMQGWDPVQILLDAFDDLKNEHKADDDE